MTDLPTTAHALIDADISIIPVKADGTKAPALPWKPYTQQRADHDTATAWFTDTTYGLGIITGSISNNLLMVEIEGDHISLLPELVDTAHASGLSDLWQTVSTGWVEQSPSGGMHWLIRTTNPPQGNQKLARAEDGTVIAETRGEGGYVVAAPTSGAVHATGKAWTRIIGGPTTIPTLDTDNTTALLELFSSLNQHTPTVVDAPPPTRPHNPDTDGVRPGDDYNARADWSDILTGWTPVKTFHDGGIGWRRPGKNDPGISATTGRNDADNLYVFSSSTEFEQEKAYSKFAAHTLLNHGGDWAAAARDLAGKGYGSEPHIRAPHPIGDTTSQLLNLNPGDTPTTEGSLATVHNLDQHRDTNSNSLAQSDDGNALLLVNRHRDRIRYCTDRGRWLVWNGHVWTWQAASGGLVREFAKQVARTLPEGEKAELRHKRHALSAPGTSNMLTQAATDSRITVTMDDLDAHPWELNTPGGIIDLRAGTLQPSDPNKLHTRTTGCVPNLAADNTLWERFLTTTFAGDTDLIGYLQRLTGYSTVGEVLEHILPFALGSGGNGKSVFFEVIAGVLGDYATSSPSGFLMASAFHQHSTEIARLSGARFVTCSEVNESDRFDEAKVKELTGGDSLTARFMRQDDFTFTPTHHLWLMGNFRPAVLSGGDGFWRRVRVIPFTHTVPATERIDGLAQKLITEHGPAVLAWIMQGAADYAQRGLDEPAVIGQATEQYATDVDTVGRFMDEECHTATGPSARSLTVGVPELRKAYERWCDDNGEQPLSGRAFTDHLKRRGVLVGRDAPKGSQGRRLYGGITLVSRDSDEHDGDRGGF